MSVLDGLNDEKLAKIASAVRKWSMALDRVGLSPLRHITVSELDAVMNLMAAFPDTERATTDDEQVNSNEG